MTKKGSNNVSNAHAPKPKGHGDSSKNNQSKKPNPNRKPNQTNNEPKLTRKEIEKLQEEKADQNLQEIDHQIRLHERNQRSSGKGINQTTTLIKNSLLQLTEIPNLDKFWIKDITFVRFLPDDNNGDTDAIKFLNVDLSWLLKLPFNEFWSECLFNASLSASVESFLRFARRNHDSQVLSALASNQPHPFFSHPHLKILYKRFFCVIERMSQPQEGTYHIQQSYYANQILNKKKIFDIPRVLDIASLFGHSNPELVSKIFHRLFSLGDVLFSEFKNNAVHIINSLQNTLRQIKTSITKQSPDLGELFAYYLDLFVNLSAILLLFPESTHFFVQKDLKETLHLVVLKSSRELLPLIKESSIASQLIFKLQLEILEKAMASIIWSIVDHCYLSPSIDRMRATSSCKSCHQGMRIQMHLLFCVSPAYLSQSKQAIQKERPCWIF